jgi:hypothetical protein
MRPRGRPSLRLRVPLWAIVGSTAACNGLLGFDDYRFDGIDAGVAGTGGDALSAAAVGGAAGMSGGAGGRGAGGAGGGEGGGSAPCNDTIACYGPPPTVEEATAVCNQGAPKGACVPSEWDYCGCKGQSPALFVEYGSQGELSAVTLIAPTSDEPYNLGINSAYCAYAPQSSCASTCSSRDTLYRWTDFEGHGAKGDVTELNVWRRDTGPPCDPGPAGIEGEQFFSVGIR